MLKKDKLVEEFWKWYKTVRTVNWKELGEDYLFGPKDFLTVGVLLKAVGFDKIMAYLVLKKQALMNTVSGQAWAITQMNRRVEYEVSNKMQLHFL